jgi:hypothetical protein
MLWRQLFAKGIPTLFSVRRKETNGITCVVTQHFGGIIHPDEEEKPYPWLFKNALKRCKNAFLI